jgi:hypothetical protein
MSSTNWNLSPRDKGALAQAVGSAVGTLTPSFGALVTIASLTGGETIALTLSSDGTTYGAAIKPIDTATHAAAASAALPNGQFWVDFPFTLLKVTKSAASANPVDVSYLMYY